MENNAGTKKQIVETVKEFVKSMNTTQMKCPDCGYRPPERESPDNDVLVKLARQVLDKSSAFDLVSVQPMDAANAKFTFPQGSDYFDSARTTKYKVMWSPESVQDFRKDTSGVEELMQECIASEIAGEIDRWLISEMVHGACIRRGIDFGLYAKSGKQPREFVRDQAIKTADELQDKTGRPYSNWIVASPCMVSILIKRDSSKRSIYVKEVGVWETPKGNMRVFEDPLMDSEILFGYKGESNLDSGCVYGPYVLLQKSPTILDPKTFSPQMGFLHRGCVKLTDNAYYGILKMPI